MFSATVNETTFSIARDGERLLLDGTPIDWQLDKVGERDYHLIWNNKRYHIEMVTSPPSKTVVLKVNGKRCEVSLKDNMDLLLEKMGLNNNLAGKVNNVKAPMPGLILEVRVQVGSVVAAGDNLLVLEAMKMENIIKATGDGTVKAVRVSRGNSVEKGQVLIEF